ALTQQRVPRHALADARTVLRVVGGAQAAALDATGGRVEVRRTHGLNHARNVEVAVAGLDELVLVVQVARIPVVVLVAEAEGAFQRTHEAVGVQIAFGRARHFPGTTQVRDRAGARRADRREVAGALHRSAERARLERIAGDLAGRDAVVV